MLIATPSITIPVNLLFSSIIELLVVDVSIVIEVILNPAKIPKTDKIFVRKDLSTSAILLYRHMPMKHDIKNGATISNHTSFLSV